MANIAKHLQASSPSKGHKMFNADRTHKRQATLSFAEYVAKYYPQAQVEVAPTIESLQAEIARLKGEAAPAPVIELAPAPKPTTPVKDHTWTAWAVARFSIPATKGATFEYVSKKRGTTSLNEVVKVNKDGSVVSKRVNIERKAA